MGLDCLLAAGKQVLLEAIEQQSHIDLPRTLDPNKKYSWRQRKEEPVRNQKTASPQKNPNTRKCDKPNACSPPSAPPNSALLQDVCGPAGRHGGGVPHPAGRAAEDLQGEAAAPEQVAEAAGQAVSVSARREV